MNAEKRHRVAPKHLSRARTLRRELTPAEFALWRRLSSGQLGGFKFRRQHPIGSYVVDFYCPAACLVVEIDGDTHAEQAEYDAERTAKLEARGLRVIRFTNSDVHERLTAVLEAILAACEEKGR